MFIFFFFNDTATTEIYTLSLHDALPICIDVLVNNAGITRDRMFIKMTPEDWQAVIETNLNSKFNVTKQVVRSEEHTSELQSQSNLVCRLLLEKKKKKQLNVKHSENLMQH